MKYPLKLGKVSEISHNDVPHLLVADPDSVEAGVEDVRPAESVGSQQSRHLPLRVAELGGEVGHEGRVVEEGGGEVEEGV